MDPESTNDSTVSSEGPSPDGQGFSRRDAIKYGSIGAGLLVATPTILTLGATPASASGDGATKYALAADTSGRSVSLSIDNPGLWVVAFYVRGNVVGSSTQPITINTPTSGGTWTPLFAQRGTNSSGNLNTRITMRAWYRWEDPALWDENADTPVVPYTLSIAYNSTAGGGTTTGLVRGATGYNFPSATTATNVQTSTVGSGSVSESTASEPGSRFLFMSGGIHSATLTSSAPSGYSGTSNNLDTSANSTTGSIAVASYLSTTKYPVAGTSGSVSASWNTAPTTQASMLVAVG